MPRRRPFGKIDRNILAARQFDLDNDSVGSRLPVLPPDRPFLAEDNTFLDVTSKTPKISNLSEKLNKDVEAIDADNLKIEMDFNPLQHQKLDNVTIRRRRHRGDIPIALDPVFEEQSDADSSITGPLSIASAAEQGCASSRERAVRRDPPADHHVTVAQTCIANETLSYIAAESLEDNELEQNARSIVYDMRQTAQVVANATDKAGRKNKLGESTTSKPMHNYFEEHAQSVASMPNKELKTPESPLLALSHSEIFASAADQKGEPALPESTQEAAHQSIFTPLCNKQLGAPPNADEITKKSRSLVGDGGGVIPYNHELNDSDERANIVRYDIASRNRRMHSMPLSLSRARRSPFELLGGLISVYPSMTWPRLNLSDKQVRAAKRAILYSRSSKKKRARTPTSGVRSVLEACGDTTSPLPAPAGRTPPFHMSSVLEGCHDRFSPMSAPVAQGSAVQAKRDLFLTQQHNTRSATPIWQRTPPSSETDRIDEERSEIDVLEHDSAARSKGQRHPFAAKTVRIGDEDKIALQAPKQVERCSVTLSQHDAQSATSLIAQRSATTFREDRSACAGERLCDMRLPATETTGVSSNCAFLTADDASQKLVTEQDLEAYRSLIPDNGDVLQSMLRSRGRKKSPFKDSVRDSNLLGFEIEVGDTSSLHCSEVTVEDGEIQEKVKRGVTKEADEEFALGLRSDTNRALGSQSGFADEKNILDETDVKLQGLDHLKTDCESPSKAVNRLKCTGTDAVKGPTGIGDEPDVRAKKNEEVSKRVNEFGSNGSSITWTAEEAGVGAKCQIFHIAGRKYRHPVLPPGWVVGVSKTKNAPYYVHPDHGATWYAPVVLPSYSKSSSPTATDGRQEDKIGYLYHQVASAAHSPGPFSHLLSQTATTLACANVFDATSVRSVATSAHQKRLPLRSSMSDAGESNLQFKPRPRETEILSGSHAIPGAAFSKNETCLQKYEDVVKTHVAKHELMHNQKTLEDKDTEASLRNRGEALDESGIPWGINATVFKTPVENDDGDGDDEFSAPKDVSGFLRESAFQQQDNFQTPMINKSPHADEISPTFDPNSMFALTSNKSDEAGDENECFPIPDCSPDRTPESHRSSTGPTPDDCNNAPRSPWQAHSPAEDSVSALGSDGASFLVLNKMSLDTNSLGSRSTGASRMSYRVLHPPHPICCLQRLSEFPMYVKSGGKQRKRTTARSKKKNKYTAIPRVITTTARKRRLLVSF